MKVTQVSIKGTYMTVLSCVGLFVAPWTVGDLPNPGIKPASLMSPVLADRFFITGATWETLSIKGMG